MLGLPMLELPKLWVLCAATLEQRRDVRDMAVIYFLPDFFHLSSVLAQLQREQRDRQAAQGEAADNGGVEAGVAGNGEEAAAHGAGDAGTGIGGEEVPVAIPQYFEQLVAQLRNHPTVLPTTMLGLTNIDKNEAIVVRTTMASQQLGISPQQIVREIAYCSNHCFGRGERKFRFKVQGGYQQANCLGVYLGCLPATLKQDLKTLIEAQLPDVQVPLAARGGGVPPAAVPRDPLAVEVQVPLGGVPPAAVPRDPLAGEVQVPLAAHGGNGGGVPPGGVEAGGAAVGVPNPPPASPPARRGRGGRGRGGGQIEVLQHQEEASPPPQDLEEGMGLSPDCQGPS
eukprot:Em0822g1a